MIVFKFILHFKFLLNDLNLGFRCDSFVHLGSESHLILRLGVSIFLIGAYTRVIVIRFNVLLRPLNELLADRLRYPNSFKVLLRKHAKSWIADINLVLIQNM
jgi:hypothetical protein